MTSSSPLDNLPLELAIQIISYLDVLPESHRDFTREPSLSLVLHPPDHDAPLKALACVSRTWRQLVLPTLFRYVRLPLTYDRVLGMNIMRWDEQAEDLRQLLTALDLCRRCEGLTMFTGRGQVRDHGHKMTDGMWESILSFIQPKSVTVLAPPGVLEDIVGLSTVRVAQDDWAFDIPFQLLHVSRPSKPLRPSLFSPCTPPGGENKRPSKLGLLHALAWEHLVLNEGCAIKAYSTYEYFLKHMPSPINGLSLQSSHPTIAGAATTPTGPIVAPLSDLHCSLQSFDYIAIFPFASHVETVSKFAEALPGLRRFSVQLAPDPRNSGILEDKRRMGTADPNDMYMELDSAYNFIAAAIFDRRADERRLRIFECRDYVSPALRSSLDEKFSRGLRGWYERHGDGGTWMKSPTMVPAE